MECDDRRRRALILCVLSVLAAAGCGRESAPTPAALPAAIDAYISSLPDGWGAVTAAELHDWIRSSSPFVLDVRDAQEIRSEGYIAGSVVIPIRSLMTNLDKLPGGERPIVVSCSSGHRSALAMAALQMMGYTNVKALTGGFHAWKKANLPVEMGTAPGTDRLTSFRQWLNWRFRPTRSPTESGDELRAALDRYLSNLPGSLDTIPAPMLKDLLDSSRPLQLDVRDAGEVAARGAIEGATMVPIRTLIKNLNKLPPDRRALIITECEDGHRAAVAMLALNVLGYTNVKTLMGGLSAWTRNGLPLAR